MKKLLLLIIPILLTLGTKAQTPLTTAVDFTVTTVEGQSFNLFNKLNENKYVVIDFFFYSCGPCQVTAPKVNGAYEYFGCNTSNVYFIGIDNGDNTATTIAFGNDFGAHYPAVSGTDGGGNAVCSAYQIGAYPTVILIAPNKTILDNDIWPITDAPELYNFIQSQGGIAGTCPPANIEETTTSDHINLLIMPNPANENTRIIFTAKPLATYTIKVYDLMGKQVYSHSLTSADNVVSHDLETLKLATGNYLVKIFENEIPVGIEKLSVIR